MKPIDRIALLITFFSLMYYGSFLQADNTNESVSNNAKTKIVATLGPSSFSNADELLLHTDIVRLNFSHGDHSDHKSRYDYVKNWTKETGKQIHTLADLQGPKIRLGTFKNSQVTLNAGDVFTFTTDINTEGDAKSVSVDYADLTKDVKIDDILVIGDGIMNLKVTEVNGNAVVCEVLNKGTLSNRKGINKFGGGFSAPALTEKDKRDLLFALSMGVDYIAVSFVKTKEDIQTVKDIIHQNQYRAKIVAKIETKEAIDNLEEITAVADMLMVARGDLGIELGIDSIPYLQKKIISAASGQGKPVITATQMMTSMIQNISPTRAEVSDIANAVYDGTDMIMFSEETAVGLHPHLVVKIAKNICLTAETTKNKVLLLK